MSEVVISVPRNSYLLSLITDLAPFHHDHNVQLSPGLSHQHGDANLLSSLTHFSICPSAILSTVLFQLVAHAQLEGPPPPHLYSGENLR